MNFPDKGKLLDTLKGSMATLALFLAFITLPPVGVFAPLPAMYYALKSGKSVGIAVVLITTALLAIISDPMLLLIYLAQSGLISVIVPYSLGKGWGAGRTIAFGVVVVVAFLLLFAAFFWLVQGIDPHAAVVKEISSWIPQMTAFYEKVGYKGEELQSLQQIAKDYVALIARIYPAIVLIGIGATAGLNLLALRRLAARLGQTLPVGDFRKFRNPDHLVWFAIAAGFALFITNSLVSTAALNLLVVTLSLYFLQGLAIILHFFDRFAVSRFFRAIFYVMLALQPYLAFAAALLGVFDLWGNFRTPKQQNL
jgi:uncharacterized protein YybS (DUF2232 family)